MPEQISVCAAITDRHVEEVEALFRRNEFGFCLERKPSFEDCRIVLGELICLNKDQPVASAMRPVPVQLPENIRIRDLFLLTTEIKIFGRWKFDDYDCQLTFPHRVFDLGVEKQGQVIEFSYKTGVNPHFEHIEAPC